ncbi:MAG: prepilin-type N-terminal cleavage/methylation domain-containing protein [bacterium]|nr:prepilin-type N-terminal cleavage/methylation domain-containing protein [bacterium]
MKAKGFTLIELLAVMTIIATICALALPDLGRLLTNIKVRSTVRQVSALLNYARGQAVVHGTNYQVNFEEKSCWLTKKEDDSYVRLTGREGKTLFIPDEVAFKAEIESITFYPKGISSGGEIIIENFRIVVDEVTGIVEVLREKKSG